MINFHSHETRSPDQRSAALAADYSLVRSQTQSLVQINISSALPQSFRQKRLPLPVGA